MGIGGPAGANVVLDVRDGLESGGFTALYPERAAQTVEMRTDPGQRRGTDHRSHTRFSHRSQIQLLLSELYTKTVVLEFYEIGLPFGYLLIGAGEEHAKLSIVN